MKWLLSIIFIIISSLTYADEAKVKWPDCYCTDKTGARVELGTEICMQVGGRDFIARCEMSLNNPMWREISQGCLSSSNHPTDDGDPVINAHLVDA